VSRPLAQSEWLRSATVIKDGDLVRLCYRGDRIPGAHWRDGYRWTKPDLNLYELGEFPDGNVVLDEGLVVNHNFSPFIDERPGVPADQRYKALGGLTYPVDNWPGWKTPGERDEVIAQHGPPGLRAFGSPDGIHWIKLQDDPVITDGAFDSQNVAFWSSAEQLRIDGFVSVHAGAEEGEFITKPFTFQGSQLEINESTSAAGRIRVEIQDADGKPLEGFALDDSETIYGDRIRHVVRWGDEATRSADVSRLAGLPIRLRFVMQEADLYSLKFEDGD
jgi:hypothetical protein